MNKIVNYFCYYFEHRDKKWARDFSNEKYLYIKRAFRSITIYVR